jgi:hypothetical protein
MRAQRNFEASAKGSAVDSGDHWDRGILHRILDLLKAGTLWSPTEFTDISTSNKGAPLAHEDDAGGSIANCGHHAIEQPLADMPTQRIHGRIVDNDKSDLAIGLKTDSFS